MFYLLTFALNFGLTFLMEAGMIWVLCWVLKAVGVTAVFGWEVAFSWTLVHMVMIISSIFRICCVKEK